jgi:hypothetical protein
MGREVCGTLRSAWSQTDGEMPASIRLGDREIGSAQHARGAGRDRTDGARNAGRFETNVPVRGGG